MIAGLFPFITINGVGFDPFIRGWLVVGVGALVLFGSVYLILATNTGARTGLMIAFTAFFGWMSIMGVIWWIYGIGLKGPAPVWNIMEVNRGDLASARFKPVRELGVEFDKIVKAQGGDVQAYFQNVESDVGEKKLPVPHVAGWKAMVAANPARGEAQATVDAFLIGSKEYLSNQEYLALGAFEIGGKDKRSPTLVCHTQNVFKVATTGDCYRRAAAKLKTIFVQPLHPARYAVIMVQPADQRTLIARPGQAPAKKQVDANEPIESVIMVRNLGSVRLPSAVITLGSMLAFAGFGLSLHRRDKRQTANRALVVPAGAGAR